MSAERAQACFATFVMASEIAKNAGVLDLLGKRYVGQVDGDGQVGLVRTADVGDGGLETQVEDIRTDARHQFAQVGQDLRKRVSNVGDLGGGALVGRRGLHRTQPGTQCGQPALDSVVEILLDPAALQGAGLDDTGAGRLQVRLRFLCILCDCDKFPTKVGDFLT